MAQELLIKMDSVKSSGMDWFYRMEALAKAVDNFVQVTFLCKSADDAGIQYLKSKDLSVMKYVDEADLIDIVKESSENQGGCSIIIDNKHRVSKLDKLCSEACNKVIYMDEAASRSFKADMIINPLYGSQLLEYFVAPECEKILGTEYNLVREEFLEIPPIRINKFVDTILVHLGETTSNNLTREFLAAIADEEYDFKVVLDTNLVNREQIKREYKERNIKFISEEDICMVAGECDIAICGVNHFMYELATLGIPMIGVMLSKDRVKESQYLVRDGLIEILGAAGIVATADILSALNRMAINRDRREDIHDALIREFRAWEYDNSKQPSTTHAAKAVIKLLK
ncbi:MAG: hypothetical protein ATN34_04210 [Epulopiscium sp. Nele67-Bin002]|nr:MAG: hypothetical protein BEN18_03505 [Epulopiscium sp. Nuni2H_MBin001]OON92545.1 MAG: hypothetical protein ATN34_04210 [Epulopiscium sp. Nele67-Bin002]